MTQQRDVKLPSAKLTPAERARLPLISIELAKNGITPERWELEALTRGAHFRFGNLHMLFEDVEELAEFN